MPSTTTCSADARAPDDASLAGRLSGPGRAFASVARRVLYAVVLLQAIGAAWLVVRDGSAVGHTLFIEWALVSEGVSIAVERALALGAVVAAGWLAWRPSRSLALGMCAWFALLAVGSWYVGGHAFHALAPVAHATRWGAPLALALLLAAPGMSGAAGLPGERDATTAAELLRWVVALTFLAHGFEALGLHPRFMDYLYVAAERLGGFELGEVAAQSMLLAIGAVDVLIAVALVVLRRHWKPILGYMVFWGALTAASRVVWGGWGQLPMALVRAANFGVPLALLWWLHRTDTCLDTPSSEPRR